LNRESVCIGRQSQVEQGDEAEYEEKSFHAR
jgi:hypothetical protein